MNIIMPQNSGNHVKRNSGSKLDNDKVEQLPDPVEFWKRNEQFFSMGSNGVSELLNVAAKLIKENSLGYESFTNVSHFVYRTFRTRLLLVNV